MDGLGRKNLPLSLFAKYEFSQLYPYSKRILFSWRLEQKSIYPSGLRFSFVLRGGGGGRGDNLTKGHAKCTVRHVSHVDLWTCRLRTCQCLSRERGVVWLIYIQPFFFKSSFTLCFSRLIPQRLIPYYI